MLHPYVQIRMQQRHENILRGLVEMDPAEVKAIFDRCANSFARVDAVKAGNWVLYVELGGDIEIARKADPLSFPSNVEDWD